MEKWIIKEEGRKNLKEGYISSSLCEESILTLIHGDAACSMWVDLIEEGRFYGINTMMNHLVSCDTLNNN